MSHDHRPAQAARGFTLIELLVVVAIVAILAAIAVPAYSVYVLRSHRADARSALLNAQAAQEKYRTFNTTYAADTATLSLPGSTDGGRYTVAISNATSAGFTVTATTAGAQLADTDCANLTLTQTGPDTSDAAKRECWSK